MQFARRIPGAGRRASAFTLVELLVVIGIIALLISILMPTLAGVRRSAYEMKCAANMRQVAQAIFNYAANNQGRFPPNFSTGGSTYWYDKDRIGKYLPSSGPTSSTDVRGGVLICPMDDGSLRSYAMNVWVSSDIDPNILNPNPPLTAGGRLWAPRSGNSARTLLLVERWSSTGGGGVFWAPPTAGSKGSKPGPRFGADPGFLITEGRFGKVNSELAFYRHRHGGGGKAGRPVGRLNFAYVDGHVAMKSNRDLADPQTTLSTLDSWWSPMDYALNVP